MEGARRWGAGGALVVLVLVSPCPACDDGRALEVEELCPPAACDGGDCAPHARRDCTGQQRGEDAGSASVPPPTDLMVPPCMVCVRAEACCKAAGLTDCHYTKACASATPAVQRYYVARCQAVIDASASGDKTLPDVCSF
jgi:hypothetical protein